ncbi:MAG: hypothetical protein JXA64_06840 [Candidatus Fermentibacteraceae bacterium]|nr:hypothetical protein [Candidatus Fermentibacteraceae bacterium]MBN2608815.1 hypothetical protein [Candidatus Fermentibacteraceae bacterium]
MLRGIVLFLALVSGDTPQEAVENTWAALRDGSPRDFLGSLTDETSSAILDTCREYLDTLRTLTGDDLGEIFASVRLEAAPDEVHHWDAMAVLEMVISSPGHHSLLNDTEISIDSVDTRDGVAVVYLTVMPPDGSPEEIIIMAASSPLGWRTGGLEPLAESALEYMMAP